MIREITRNDRDSFLRLSDEFYKSEAVLHDIPAAYHEAAFDELMRSKEYASAYMIEWEGEIVGYLLTAKTYSREAGGLVLWLEEMYMRPAYRSKGLGKRRSPLSKRSPRAKISAAFVWKWKRTTCARVLSTSGSAIGLSNTDRW